MSVGPLVGIRCPFSYQSRASSKREKFKGEIFLKPFGDCYIRHAELSRVINPGINARSKLGRGESDGNVRPHGRSHGPSRVRVESGGYVNGNARGALAVYEFYKPFVKAPHVPVESGAENGVDYNVRVLYPGEFSLKFPYVGPDLKKRVEVCFRVSLVMLFLLGYVDAYVLSRGNKMAGDHEAVPRVVSRAADNRHFLRRGILFYDGGRHGSSGVFHQHDARHSEFLNSPSVYFP